MKWENNICEFHTVKISTKRRPIALKCASSEVYSVHTSLKYKLITKYYSQFCLLHSFWFAIDPKVGRYFCRLNQSNDSAISRWLYFIVFIFSIFFFCTRQRIAATAIITTKCKTIRKLSIFMKELFLTTTTTAQSTSSSLCHGHLCVLYSIFKSFEKRFVFCVHIPIYSLHLI